MPAIIIFIAFIAALWIILYAAEHAPYMDDSGNILPDDYDWSHNPDETNV